MATTPTKRPAPARSPAAPIHRTRAGQVRASGGSKRLAKSDPDGLLPPQRLFVEAYLVNLNGREAAIRAGYAPASAVVTASKMLTNPKVATAVTRGLEEQRAKFHLSAEEVLGELKHIAFSNMLDYIRVQPDTGDAYVDLSHMTREQAAAISQLTSEEYLDGRGEDARQVKKVYFKLSDKIPALVALGKHLKLFVERQELTGKDGGPVQIEDARDRLLAKLAAFQPKALAADAALVIDGKSRPVVQSEAEGKT